MWIFTLFCPRPIKLALLGRLKCLKSSYRFTNCLKRLRQLLLWFKMAKNTTPKKFLRFFAVVKFFPTWDKIARSFCFCCLGRFVRFILIGVPLWADIFSPFDKNYVLKKIIKQDDEFFLQGLIREEGCLIIEPFNLFTNKE